ncbi:MAG: hypothetical protein AAGL34_11145 [Bacteroidota bacterium]
MQNLFFSILLLCFAGLLAQNGSPTQSQEQMESFVTLKRNELSIDVIAALGIPAFNPRYEYVLGTFSGLGLELFISFDSEEDFIDYSEFENFSLTPYYRQYFFSKEDFGAKGFYAEGFLKFFTFDGIAFDPILNMDVKDSYFETAIGVGIGGKWVSQNGFLVDIGLGLGRNLGIDGNPEDFDNDVQLRGGLHFGWRF